MKKLPYNKKTPRGVLVFPAQKGVGSELPRISGLGTKRQETFRGVAQPEPPNPSGNAPLPVKRGRQLTSNPLQLFNFLQDLVIILPNH